MKESVRIGIDDHGRRLDVVVRRFLSKVPLGVLQRALRTGDIRLNGSKVSGQTRVMEGDVLSYWVGMSSSTACVPLDPLLESSLPLSWIVWQSEHYMVINKPSGLLVHHGDAASTALPLDERVRTALSGTLPSSLSFRPGPLHRLDKETSGLIVFSCSLSGARAFSQALREHQVRKIYLAILRGNLTGPITVQASLERHSAVRTTVVSESGSVAQSTFRPLASNGQLTLAEVEISTGRTHQIRAHASHEHFPLMGDRKYGGGPSPEGMNRPFFLHCWYLQAPGLPALKADLSPRETEWLKKNFKFSLEPAENGM